MSRFDKNKVFWWSPKPFLGLRMFQKENVGDLLGPLLVEKILAPKNLKINEIKKQKLLTIGSVIHFAKSGDTLWGTGVNGKINENEHTFQNLDVRAVRGHLTADFLRKRAIVVPDVFGDPGLLVSDFWPRKNQTEKGKIIYIPHMREKVVGVEGVTVLSPLVDIENFLAEIQTAEKVVSSSLHGVIIAESYGIPANLYANNSGETHFKYEDYYSGTNRSAKVFKNFKDAVLHDPSVPELTDIKLKLLNAFPFDLWS